MNLTELLVGIAILVGLVGIVLPIVPGSILILSAILVWATEDGSRTAWIVFSVATVLLMSGAIVKYTIPGRSLKASGVPNRSLLGGGLDRRRGPHLSCPSHGHRSRAVLRARLRAV